MVTSAFSYSVFLFSAFNHDAVILGLGICLVPIKLEGKFKGKKKGRRIDRK